MKLSLKDILRNKETASVPRDAVAESNNRIKEVMKESVRNFQKKQRNSLEKASKIVLNA